MNIAVSACLLGEPCRYDGRAKPCASVQELAKRGHELLPICPEVAGGLPTPRTPCEIVRAPWKDGVTAAPARDNEATTKECASAQTAAARGSSPAATGGSSQSAKRDGHPWTIVDANGADRTAAYARGAQTELARAKKAGCELAVLKAKSPSCGVCEVYDGTFSGTLVPGRGITAAAFLDAGIPVIDETADFCQLS